MADDSPPRPSSFFRRILRAERLEGNGALGALLAAVHTGDALPVAYPLDIHLAVCDTGSAAIAFVLIHMGTDHGDPIEQGVKRPQGAEKAAKEPVAEYRPYDAQQQHQALPGKQPARQRPQGLVLDQQRNAALQSTGWA